MVQVTGAAVVTVVQVIVDMDAGNSAPNATAHCCTSYAAMKVAVQLFAPGTTQPPLGTAELNPGSDMVTVLPMTVTVVDAGAKEAQ